MLVPLFFIICFLSSREDERGEERGRKCEREGKKRGKERKRKSKRQREKREMKRGRAQMMIKIINGNSNSFYKDNKVMKIIIRTVIISLIANSKIMLIQKLIMMMTMYFDNYKK